MQEDPRGKKRSKDLSDDKSKASRSKPSDTTADNELLRRAIAMGKDARWMEHLDWETSYRQIRLRIVSQCKKHFVSRYTRFAAILSIPLLIATFVLAYLQFTQPAEASASERFVEITSASGLVVSYELPDGTKVWLNSESKLRYPSAFEGNVREVELEGEAYFQVKADKIHPFYVITPDGMRVYAFGTEFDVSAYSDDDYIEAVLANGCLHVIGQNKQVVELFPGQSLKFNRESRRLDLKSVDVYERTAWKDGKLVFRSTPLDVVLKKLSRHFNTDIVLDNPKNKQYNYRATFCDESLSQILDYLSKSTQRMTWHQNDWSQFSNGTIARRKVKVTID